MEKLLQSVRANYPDITLVEGEVFSWSPKNKVITYRTKKKNFPSEWSLLHELSHALLEHHSYETDFELLLIEVEAWEKAKELAADNGISIDEEHIQDCIDTYRDWLYQRSACPTCGNISLQQDSTTYKCFNCAASWTVTASRFCRPYRLTSKQLKTPLPAHTDSGTTFL